MTELQEMQQEIAQLKEETRALKLRSRAQMMRQRFVFGAAVVGLGVALMSHNGNTQTTTPSGNISARHINVIDKNDNVVMTLGSTVDGEGSIAVYNGGKKRIVAITATNITGEGIIVIGDQDGTPTVNLQSNKGLGSLWLKK